MDEETLRRIATLEATVDQLLEDEHQDRALVAEMASTFLANMRTDSLKDLNWYIRMYSRLEPSEISELVEVVNAEVEAVIAAQTDECPYTHSHTRSWCGHAGCRES